MCKRACRSGSCEILLEMAEFRRDLAGGWAAEDGSKALLVEIASTAILVSLYQKKAGEMLIRRRRALWNAPKKSARYDTLRNRVGFLQVELGDPGLGSTYDLFFVVLSAGERYRYAPISEATRTDEIYVLPRFGASFFDAAVGGDDDDAEEMRLEEQAGLRPLVPYRRSSPEDASFLKSMVEGKKF